MFERLHLPSLGGAAEWLNSEPLGPAELRGHVVVVNFWTLTCINWLRQEPYVRAWSQAYQDDGLVVIGVHTPEFSFEHEIDRVRRATKERAIDYPVAVDNDYESWSAFDNHYWRAALDERRAYELPERLRSNQWALAGDCTIGRENVVLDQAGGSIAYRFHARDAHLVLSPGAREPIPFGVLLEARLPARRTEWTSRRTGAACSGTAACTSSCASRTLSASGRWRSRSSIQAARRTRSRSGSQEMATYLTNHLG